MSTLPLADRALRGPRRHPGIPSDSYPWFPGLAGPIPFAVLLLGAALAAPAAGQDAAAPSARIGLGSLGQTTVLDDRYNPALSFVGDFVASWGEEDAREAGADGFLLRAAEVGIFGAVDDVLEYHGVVFFDEEEVELEEAYAIARDWLPHRFSLKGGRYNVDFGKQSPLHDHDLATLDKPAVLQEYLGGTLRGTGAELHWWSPLGDTSLFRISGGILQDADGDSHAVLGPASGHEHGDEEEDEEGPIRDVEDFAGTLRLTSLVDTTESSTLQFGASALYAPTSVFGVDESDERDLDQTVLGADITWTRVNEETGGGLTLQGEFLHSDADFGTLDEAGTPGDPVDDTFSVMGESANGFYGLAELRPSRRWAFGASGGVFEHAEDADEDTTDIGVFVTWKRSEFNRLRLEVRSYSDLAHEHDGMVEELDFIAVSLQWTVILGSHGHGLDG